MRMWRWLLWLGVPATRPVGPRIRAELSRASAGGRVWCIGFAGAWVLLVALGVFAAAWKVHERLWDTAPSAFTDVLEDLVGEDGAPYFVAWAGVVAIVTAIVGGGAYLKRRLRLLALLRHRDLCWRCGHGLAGLRVHADSSVACPECTAKNIAFVEWGEVSTGDTSPFAPATGVVRVFWTRAKLVRLGRASAVIAGVSIVAYGSWWVWREVGIRKEAVIAASERVDPERITALLRGDSVEQGQGTVVAEDVIAGAFQKYTLLMDQFRRAHVGEVADANAFEPDPAYIVYESTVRDTSENRRYAAMFVGELRAKGLFDDLDRLRDASVVSHATFVPLDLSQAQPRIAGILSNTGRLERASSARAQLAVEAGDLPEFLDAVRTSERISRAAGADGRIINWMAATGQYNRVLTLLNKTVCGRPNSEWLTAIAGELDRREPLPFDRYVEAERLSTMDALAWYFSEPARVRLGLDAAGLELYFGVGSIMGQRVNSSGQSQPALRLGSYTENRDQAALLFEWVRGSVAKEPWQRSALERLPPTDTDLAIIDSLKSLVEAPDRYVWRALVHERALRTKVALEQYRHAHGVYPSSLEELVPTFIASLPADPFSGRSLGYRLGSSDGGAATYTLWSVGKDGVDDAGVINTGDPEWAYRSSGPGYDIGLSGDNW